MGLKSGSRDSGLDDSSDETDRSGERDEENAPTTDADETSATAAAETAETSDASDVSDVSDTPDTPGTSESGATARRPTRESIPYKLRRETVNEGREQIPYFLREGVIEGEADLRDTLESLLGEDVYKSDYREAAMIVAQRNPELVAEILREWGYDLDAA